MSLSASLRARQTPSRPHRPAAQHGAVDLHDGDTLIGVVVCDADGRRLGKVCRVIVHKENGRPEWVAVRTGRFTSRVSLVPLAEMRATARGLSAPYQRSCMRSAPRVHGSAHLSSQEEAELYRYFDLRHTDIDSHRGHSHVAMPPG